MVATFQVSDREPWAENLMIYRMYALGTWLAMAGIVGALSVRLLA